MFSFILKNDIVIGFKHIYMFKSLLEQDT